jgi:hypothetical protein
VAWSVQHEGLPAAGFANAAGLTPYALASATAAARRRLRVNLRTRFPDLHIDVTTLADRLGVIVPLELGTELVSDAFGDLPQLHFDLLLWLAGDYREERGCLGRHGTKVFDDACVALADENGVLPVDLTNALLRHECWLHAQVPALERSPRVRRVGDRWVYLGKSMADRVVAVLAALARPATLDEVRVHLGATRLPEAELAADPRLVRVGPREFAVRQLRSADARSD